MKTKRNILILSVALFGTVLLGVVVLAPQRVPTAHVYLIGVTNTYVAQPITALTATIASTVWAHIDPLTRVAMVGESVAETNATAQFEAINTLLHIAISKVSHAQSKTLAQIQILSNVIHARTQAFVAGLFRVSTETYAPLRVAAAQNFQQNKYPLPSENMLAVQLVAGAKNLHQALFANASSFAFTGTPETHALDAHSLAGSAPLGGPSLVAVAAAGAGVVSDLVLPVMHNFVTSAVLPLTRVAMVGESVAETNATAQFEAINTLLHIAISKVSHAQSKTLAQIQILSNVIHARTQAFVAGLFRVSTETYAPLRVAAAQNFQQNKYPLPSENMLAVQLVAGAKNLHQALFANASSFAFTGTPETHALDAHSLAGSAPLGGPSLVAVAAAGAGVVSDLVLPVMHNFVTSAVLSVASLFQTLYLAISLSALVLAALGFSLGGLVLFLRIQRRASRELRSRNNYINQSNIVNEPLIYRGEPEAEIISPDRASENVPVPMLSAREVARLLGCTQDYVANLCRTGKLDASMVEGVWLVRASSIKNFIEARDRAKQERSEALMEARKREIREYAKTHTPLRYYVQKLFSKRGTRADMGLVMGSVLLFGSVLLAAHVAGQNQIVSQNNTHAPSAAIGKIASPFFGFGINSVSLPSFSFVLSPNASVASVGFVSNIFSDVLHWFAPHTAQVAENTESFSTKFMVQSSTAPVLARAVPQGAGNAVGTVIEQKTYPVVERIVERTTTVSGVTAETLDTKLANLRDVLRGEIHFAISNSTPTFASGGVANNIAVSQRVDQLSGTTISNPTISGGSISGASLSGTSLNIQGNTVFSGDLSVANLSASGALTVSGTTTLQSIAPSTLLYNNASKQIAAAFVGNGLTFSNGTLATSFGTTTANTFTALQQFNANASTTQLSATAAYFGGTATSTFTSQGWLGIGTTSPYSILSISNSATTAANTPLFSIASTTGGNSTSTLMTVLANGNIGIGTTSPQWPLHVWTARGDIGLGSITTGAVSTDAGLTMTGNGTTISALFTEVGGKILSYGINVPQITTRATSSSGGIFRLDTRTGGASLNGDTHTFVVKAYSLGSSIEYNALLVDFDSGDTALSPAKGLVGIGNTSPTAQLHVKGNTSTAVTGSGAITATNASTAVSGAGTTFTTDFSVGDAIKIGTSTVAYTIATIASNTALTLATNYIGSTGTTLAAYKDPNNLFAIDNGLGTNRLTVTRAGNFGVGTSSPWGQLSVNPNGIAGPSFVIGSSTATNFVVTNTGNVGIGTAAPGNLLQINDGGTGAADSELLNLKTSYNSNGSKKSITWRDIASGNTTGQIDTRYNGTTVDMVFGSLYNNGYNSLPILTVKGNGNVGIGTTSPWGKLSVTGAGTGTGVTFAAANSSNSPLFTVLDNGTVGVGTGITYTSSNYGMLISRSLEASTTPNFTSMTAGSAQGEISDMAMYSTFVGTGDSGPRRTADIVAGFNGGAWLNEYLAFGVGFNSSTNDGRLRTTEKMRITAAGNVGIGTTIPSQKLDVAGFINTDQYSGYKQAGNTILVASTTFSSLFVGAGGNTSYTGASNVGVGGLVMSNLTTGNTNVGVGYQALQNATSSNNNVAIGYQALIGSATVSGGGQNTGVGFQALSANTSGVQNVGIGYQALQSNTTGSFNAGISTGALQLNSTGNQNSAFGWRALTAVTTGYNTAMGGQTAAAVTTGSATSAFGALALFRNTTGSNNTAMGAFAAQNNALAVDTVTVGEGAAFGNAGNYSNSGGTIVGTRAGFNFATSSDYNTFLGYQSGYLNTSGFNNIFIGPQINTVGTGYITTGANNIGLGFNTLFPSATANNQLNIGNFIFGTLPATTSNSSFSLPTSGSLGVGTTSPYATLSVHANNGSTNTTLFAIGSSTASATTTLFSVDNTGKVAVGDAASGSIYQGINAGLATQATTTIVGNTALGFNAMQTATSSTYVTAIGYRALANLNDCAALAGAAKCLLTAVGTNALFANTTGYWNTAVGAGAAQNNTTGNQNVALGSNALQANTIGSGNMAIGFASLASNISGNGNTAVGGQALQNTTASSNAAIGQYAGIFNTTGSGNSFLGTNSGEASLVATDFNSTIDTNMTFVGMLSSRDGNVIASTSALTNGTAIGYKARVGASNTLALGGLGVNAVNVGIGSSTPFAQLSLHANAGSTNTTLFAIGSSTASATSTLFSIANTGTVTTNLSSGLVANNTGSLYSFATSSLYGSVAANTVLTNANGTAGTPAFTATSTFFGTGVGGTVLTWNNGVPQWVASTTYANGTGITTSFSAGQLTITNAGLTSLTQNGGGSAQTGAITFATSSALSFNGLALGSTITNSGGTFTFGNNLSGTLNNTGLTNSTIGATSPGATLSFGSAASLGSTFTADLNLANANIWSGLQQFSSGLTAYASSTIGNGTQNGGLTISGGATTTGNAYFAGNVGVGTTSPSFNFKLDVSGKLRSFSYLIGIGPDLSLEPVAAGQSALTSWHALQLVGFKNSPVDYTPSNVGIGADAYGVVVPMQSTTAAGLAILGFASQTANYFEITSSANKATLHGDIFNVASNGNVGIATTSPYAKLSVHANNGDTNTTLFAIASSTATATTTLFTVTNAGNVGIGTTSPAFPLSVSGTSAGTAGPRFVSSNTLGTGITLENTSSNKAWHIITGGTGNSEGSGALYFNSPSIASPIIIGAGGNLGVGLTPSSSGAGQLNVGASATIGGSDSRGVLTVQKNSTTQFAANTDPTDTGRYFVMENTEANQAAAGQYANVTLQLAPTLNVGTPGVGNGRVLSDIRAVRQVASSSDMAFMFSAFGNDHVYRDYFQVSSSTNWFLGNLQVGGVGAVASTLAANGNATIGSGYTTTAAPTNGLLVQGNVGIGTTSPFANLSVNGTGYFGGNLTSTNLTATGTLAVSGLASFAGNASTTALSVFNNAYFGATATSTFTSQGWLGIGTTSPFANLSIHANSGSTNTTLFAIASSTATATTTLFSVSNTGTVSMNTGITGGQNFTFSGTSPNNTANITTASNLNIAWAGAGALNMLQGVTNRFNISSAGLVGISVASPSYNLDVAGNGHFTTGLDAQYLVATSSSIASIFNGGFLSNASSTIGNGTQNGGLTISGGATTTGNAYFAGNVGIGTTSPTNKLGVNGYIDVSATGGYKFDGNKFIYASSTNFSTVMGIGAGTGLDATSTPLYSTAIGYNALHGVALTGTTYNNTAVGYQALLSNTSGAFNNAIGTNALSNNTSGTNNTAMGFGALSGVTTGGGNFGMGVNTNQNNQAGFSNVGIGNYSVGGGNGIGTNSNNDNIGIGNAALTLLTTGNRNIGFGSSVGATISTGSNNIFVGFKTASTTATGSNNIALGYDIALPSINGSNQLNIGNAIFGTGISGEGTNLSPALIGIGTTTPGSMLSVAGDIYASGFFNTSATTGGFKIDNQILLTASSTSGLTLGGIGAGSALLATTTVNGNTGFGYQAMNVATSSTKSTAIGYRALANLNDCATASGYPSGCALTAVGWQALANNTIGIWNTAVGASALQSNTTGATNNAFGTSALGSNTTGGGNQGIGFQALNLNTTGNGNTAVGTQALSTLTGNHSNNLAFGQYSAIYSTSGDNDIFIGNQAGLGGINQLNDTNSVKDTNVIFIGVNSSRDGSGLASTSVMNNSVAIGNASRVGASNSMALGGLGANAVNVGIGSSTPYAQLSVHANNGSTNTTLFAIASSTASATTTLFSISNSGSALQTLDAAAPYGLNIVSPTGGNTYINLARSVGGSDFSVGAFGITNIRGGGGSASLNVFSSSNTVVGEVILGNGASQTADLQQWKNNGVTLAEITAGGNVGIGTTSPFATLSVNGTGYFGGNLTSTNLTATGTLSVLTAASIASTTLTGSTLLTNATSTNFFATVASSTNLFATNATIASLTAGIGSFSSTLNVTGQTTLGNASTTNLIVSSAGGIGTRCAQFDSIGTLSANASACGSGSGGGTPFTFLTINGAIAAATTSPLAVFNAAYFGGTGTTTITSAGFLGVGSSTPWANLSINALNGATNTTLFAIGSSTASATTTLFSVSNTGSMIAAADASIHGLTVGMGGGSVVSNTAVGSGALVANTTGYQNTANGSQSLFSNTTGAGNTANGYAALASNTTGTNNTANGFGALYSNTTGTDNTANGSQVLYSNTTGTKNVANGFGALRSNTTGYQNVANGFQSLFSNTTGNSNVGMGYQAGYNITTGYDNLLLGHTENTGGNAITTGGGNIGMGYNIVYPSVSQNLMLNLGNSIFGTLVATSTSTSLPTTMTGIAFGIATSTLTGNTFSVQNAVNTNKVASFFSSTGASLATLTNGGNLGIGTSTPGGTLAVNSTDSSTVTSLGYFTSVANVSGTSYTRLRVEKGAGYGGDINGFLQQGVGSGLTFNTLNGGVSSEIMRLNSAGYVGIGTTTPYANLSIHANNGATNTTLFAIGSSTASATTTLFSVSNTGSMIAAADASIHGLTVGMGGGSVVSNTAVGSGALVANTAGWSNTANGSQALASNTIGWNNTANGSQALASNIAGTDNTANGFGALNLNTTGYQNTANGSQALYSNTAGTDNTANGFGALNLNTTGANNTANGSQALYSNTTGTNNTANGTQALQLNTTGANNTANGSQALYSNTTGNSNVANGNAALRSNTTGYQNVANGYAALRFNTTGTNNTANGFGALYSNTTGGYNTANGAQALYSNTTGYQNVANGSQALYSNTAGTDNTANGYGALNLNTTGANNTANGSQALASNTSGFNNTANGYAALRFNTTGIDNTANGTQALQLNTTGYQNTANGSLALASNTTGYDNVANGYGALASNTTGTENTANGYGALNSNTTGANNTANGSQALYSNTTGYQNVANGYAALRSNTTGYQNVANGYAALRFNTTGTNNTANGYAALNLNTTGANNTANGVQALASNTTGGYNTANGTQALYSNTTGTNNIANGSQALYSNTTGGNNIANGSQALYSNTTGTNNTANGAQALQLNTTGANNTANGSQALASNTIGYDNVANGYAALRFNTTGYENVANGYAALASNTTGYDNVANGSSALASNTTGTDNTANGFGALNLNTTGANNTANGSQALYSNTTGYQNVANGYAALRFNTTGTNNTANGYTALKLNTTGANNTANGSQALQLNTTGANNTANGFQSLFSNTTGNSNVGMGYQAGYNITTGYDNLLLGHTENTGGNAITTGGGNIGMGYNIVYPSVSQNLMLNLGNSIFGTLVATSTSTSLPTTMTGIAFGIATSTLTGNTFSVQNAVNTNNVASFFSSTGASLATLTNGGNLGIGTTSPSQALSVQGNGLISGNLASANLTVTGTLTAGIINASGAITGGTNSAFGGTTQCCAVSQTPTIAISEVGATKFPWIQFHASGYQEAYMRLATSSRLFEFGDNQAVGVGLAVLNNAGTARSVVISGNSNSYFNGGNLGIGTTTPYSRLTVWGPDSAATTSAFTVTNSASTTVFAVYDNGNSTYSGSIFQSSDQRLKTNILSLDASSSLAAVEALNPVSYTRVDQTAEGQNLGFIAQQVANVFPQLVSTTSATTLTPDGTLTLNYVGLIAPIIGAIQGIAHIAGDFKENLVAWLGDAANGIHDLYVSIFHAKEVHTDMLCVGETCVTQAQFLQMVQKSGQSDPAPPPAPAPTPDPTPDPTPAPDPTPTPVTP